MNNFTFYAEPAVVMLDITDGTSVTIGAGEGSPDYLDRVFLSITDSDGDETVVFLPPEVAVEVAEILQTTAGVE